MKKSRILTIYLGTCIFDQIIKLIIKFTMKLNTSIVVIPGFFRLSYLHNTGAAFSSFSGMRYILIIISLAIFLAIIRYINKTNIKKKIETISLGLIMGGLVGNLIDRIFYGYVIDYLSFTILGYDFAVFNIADSCIVIGVTLFVINMIKEEVKKKNDSSR